MMIPPLDSGEHPLTPVELRLGKRIFELRAARRLTQDRLGIAAGLTKGYLSKIENSKLIPPIGTLVRIAQVLDTDVADLLDTDSSPNHDETICIVRSWEREMGEIESTLDLFWQIRGRLTTFGLSWYKSAS